MARRILPARRAGIDRALGAHWSGDTARRIVDDRRSKLAERPVRGKRRASSQGEVSPIRLLSRLRRALKRRKTLAARQRVAQRIKQLERELRA